MSLALKVKEFKTSFKKEVILPLSKNLVSYKILIEDLPELIKKLLKFENESLIFKGSTGQGVHTYYPWLGIFDNRVSTGATNGFYVVLLFSDDFEDLFLTLNQGSTIQSKEQIKTYKKFIYEQGNKIEGFISGEIPQGGLVKTRSGSTAKNGRKYEKTNIFYRKYKADSINENDFLEHLKSLLKFYINCADKYSQPLNTITNELVSKYKISFNKLNVVNDIENSGIKTSNNQITRFVCSILTKPFVILTGLSGSGKTKLAQAFAMWICENKKQYKIVPVGADWTNREPLLGFPNALTDKEYIKPDNGVLDLIIEANKPENAGNPYFLILDEMNLSHVERYFADFLSVMESKTKISLHSGQEDWSGIPQEIGFPTNLFIIGTVNIDETTYMFSPKVLDRANVIEFRVTAAEMESYLQINSNINLKNLEGLGANMAESFIEIAKDYSLEAVDAIELNKTLMSFFSELKKTGAEFGYRSASEILRFAAVVNKIESGWNTSDILDAAIMQKLLPKVHGSRRKLEPVLKILGKLCLADGQEIDDFLTTQTEINFEDNTKIKYPVSLEKILRMYHNLISNGFTSYAEA